MTVNITNINLGSGPDTNTGEPLRTAFTKINNNFANVKAVVDGTISASELKSIVAASTDFADFKSRIAGL